MKKIVTILFAILFVSTYGQQNNQLWGSYYSYNNIVDITQSPNRVYGAADYAMFYQSLASGELKTITSVDGLKAETITCAYHSPTYNKTLVGNNNGLLLVINPDNSIVSRVDIIEETTVQANKKRINHIYEHDGKAYISTDFGIAVFNLATSEFGDTYYLGPNGAEVSVKQSVVHNGYLYAACGDNAGLRRGALTNPNLNDFSQWQQYVPGNWRYVANHEGTLLIVDFANIFRIDNSGNALFVGGAGGEVLDFRSSGGYLISTVVNNIKLYNAQLQQQASFNIIPNESTPTFFSCATVVNEQLFIGTTTKGIFSASLNNLSFNNITPDGPLRSNIFSLEKSNNALWAVFGGYSFFYEPDYSKLGISKFVTGEGWKDIPYTEIEAKNEGLEVNSLSDIAVNPRNEDEVYVGSFNTGLVKINNDQVEEVYTPANTNNNGNEGLQSLVIPSTPPSPYRSVRINGLTYDQDGNLWMMNTRVPKPLKVLKPNGSWQSYSFVEALKNTFNGEFGKMAIDKNGTKWIPSIDDGLIGFNEKLNNRFVVINTDNNMPSDYARCVAIDNRNQLWIGTSKGLRVLRGVDRFLTEDNIDVNEIIIIDDGLAQELMYEQFITDIKVDGANNKWIGTSAAGAFLVSPDGQQTLFHFTKTNSPLPSNNINDIEIDPATGEVFFATDKGMVSYQGTSTKASDDLSKVYVFPNPVRPGFEGDVNISGLIDKANIKITDIEGNLVYETTSEGGTVLWNQRAFGKHKVASGVYMIFIASEDGTETKVKKVMIVR